jgi:hypothetical protein
MGLMLNLREGHVFVELNYPHIIGIGGMNRITKHIKAPSEQWRTKGRTGPTCLSGRPSSAFEYLICAIVGKDESFAAALARR